MSFTEENLPPPPNNPLKIFGFIGAAVICAVGIYVCAASERFLWAGICVALLVFCVAAIVMIRQGKNPWWMRSAMDRVYQQKLEDEQRR